MKYIDADLLRKDIDSWENAIDDCVGEYSDGFRFALEHFAVLIAHYSQQEQQEVDLEKEIKRYTKSCEGAKNANGHIFELDWNGITAIIDEAARHFYELGKNSK